MRIGLYDPYLDSLGGGERYVFSIASHLSNKNSVDIFWEDKSILDKATVKFNLNLKKVKIAKNIFSSGNRLIYKFFKTKKYDVIFFVSDGSIPFLFGKKNVLIFQFPVNWVKGRGFITQLKLKKVSKSIVYSEYVKKFIDSNFNVESIVVAPEVPYIDGIKSKKENIIINVGRFTNRINAKKQNILIKAFKNMCDNGLKNWKLVLIGSHLASDEEYLGHLKKLVGKYPIDIITDVSFNVLKEYYKKAKIYWHAAGFEEDLEKHPERAEHFGITTVEAMSAGAVPVVINAGGQKEIVDKDVDGYLWKTLNELQEISLKLIKSPNLMKKISKNGQKKAMNFTKEVFCKKIDNLLS